MLTIRVTEPKYQCGRFVKTAQSPDWMLVLEQHGGLMIGLDADGTTTNFVIWLYTLQDRNHNLFQVLETAITDSYPQVSELLAVCLTLKV
jgi:hypothetical protein